MIDKESLKHIIEEQKNQLIRKNSFIGREIKEEIDITLPHATILSGIRRCGKSTLLNQLCKKEKKCYYINFEDPRLIDFEVKDFIKLEEVFKQLYGEADYFFFDEIQNVVSWEIAVRRLLDFKKKCIITGSNAALLSKELGTRLTGRHLRYEIFPFSYKEFLAFYTLQPNSASFDEYIKKGGFPEYLQLGKIEILQQLLDHILARDVIVRHQIKESVIIKELIFYLFNNISKEFSYNKLAKYFNLGSSNTIRSYISYFEDSYLLFSIPKFDFSYKRQLVSNKKIYGIDTGFISANSISFSSDKGKMLENAVFLHLKRKYKDIYFYKEKRECDFIVKEKGKIIMAIQVCYELTDENMKREIDGLKEAMSMLKIKNGLILTFNQDDNFDNITVMPVWKWVMLRKD